VATSLKVTATINRTLNETRTRIRGTCASETLAPTNTTQNSTVNTFLQISGIVDDVTGNVTKDAQGNAVIIATRSKTLNLPEPDGTRTIEYTVQLNLKQEPRDTDLELDIVAPATATPEGGLTYAVNLHNKSNANANDIRAEFFLPEGFTVLDTQGWSGCVTVLTTVTCKASSLAANERRAFLIDVKAPASVGEYVVSARVSSAERDTNSSDNFDTGVTSIVEP
jgi:uncharacterized repeat protein (TIGR01451 family)